MKKRKQYILWLLSVCVAANGTAGLAAGSDVLPRDEILADETGEAWGTIPEEEIAGALAEIDIHVIDIMNENEKTGKAETDRRLQKVFLHTDGSEGRRGLRFVSRAGASGGYVNSLLLQSV